MKILVTGGTGFTGAALVHRLLKEGHEVRSLDCRKGLRDAELAAAGAEIVQGDITDADEVAEATDGVEFVFHVAAAFRQMDVDESHYYRVNVDGTRNVMAAAKRGGVRKVVYTSTQGVHGHVSDPPGDEDSPITPADYYQQTKYEGEEVVREYIADGMNATILRPMALYGPGDPARFVMIFGWAARGWFPMFGSGKTFYQPVYIDNLVDAYVLTLDEDTGRGGTYLIGDAEYLPIETLVRKVGESMGKRIRIVHLPLAPLLVAAHACQAACKPLGIAPPLFPRRADWYRQVRAFSIERARRELGYEPRVGIDEGLRRTAEWCLEHGYV